MNEYEKTILSGIKLGLREEIPNNTKALETSNILKALELDKEYRLGIFNDIERYSIIMAAKEQYLNHNPDVKRIIKTATKK